jgi:hypothetical protein
MAEVARRRRLAAAVKLPSYGQQHQKLIHTWDSRSLHFEFPESSFQFYTDFVDEEKTYVLGQRHLPHGKTSVV